jgi:small GTP-binding protein
VPKTSIDLLDEVLDVLIDLATQDDRERLAELRQRVDARRLRVLVAGEAKRGKSTLVNQMIGRDVLPTGVTPVTAVVTTVRRAEADEHIMVTFHDGRVARHDLAELADFVSERGNPLNERGVWTVEVFVCSDLLDRFDVELVDTPGTGSVFEHNTVAAEEALASLDAAIFVVSADPPIAAAERDLLARTSALSVRTFVVLNKADQLDEAGLREAEAFTAQVVAEATGVDAGLFPCSARQGLMLSVAGHLTIFLTRTRGPFWSIRPARILWAAVLGTPDSGNVHRGLRTVHDASGLGMGLVRLGIRADLVPHQ